MTNKVNTMKTQLESILRAMTVRHQTLQVQGANGNYQQDREMRNLLTTYNYLQLNQTRTETAHDYKEFVDLLLTTQNARGETQ